MFEISLRRKRMISIVLSFFGLLLPFIGGAFSTNTNLEKIAEYATDVVVNHTKNKSLCAITVEKTQDSGPIIDSDTEFHNLYGIFRQEKITFASTINSDKRHEIYLDDGLSDNLSMLYVGPVGSIDYHGHYKHYVSPMEIMFADERIYDFSRYVAYISQEHANSILEKQNVTKQKDGSYSEKDYKTLLKQIIPINIDGVLYNFGIQNIYYQTNYYYEGLHEVMGDFVIVSYYLPVDLRSEQQNMYFFSEYAYQNKYFMNYINTAYPSQKYLLKANHYNVIDNVDDAYLTSFYYNRDNPLDWFFFLSIAFSAILLFASLALALSENRRLAILLRFIVLLSPYLLFLILYKITNDVSFMSEAGSKANVISIIVYIALFVITMSVKPLFKKKKKPIRATNYETDI